MKKITYLILSLLLLYGCFPSEPTVVDRGALPDSALKYVPYKNGETYRFVHSNGQEINFKATREKHKEQTSCDCFCEYIYEYEVDNTILVPDYPIFSFNFRIDNLDEASNNCYGTIGKSGLYIPTTENDFYYNCEKADSIKINSKYYYQVFKFKQNLNNYADNEVYIDSVYYNYEKGILKILLSNNENYTLYE